MIAADADRLACAAPRRLRGGWFEARSGAGYVLSRHWPPRLDVVATGAFPPVRRGRLARQIRQDLWRALRDLRGFSPVVEIDATETGLAVRAGGRLVAPVPAGLEGRIQDLLDSPGHRARWLTWAGEGAR